ncbi:MAG: 30S ribosomal protein S4 [Candidatus Campbellbacteria bacterium]|nr:30S ribosomal protein S4 [Candidatus Campbellbacteria bacterium]
MIKLKKYKISRRLGAPVFEKCQTAKYTRSEERKRKSKSSYSGVSEYGKQLVEKQKARYTYGIREGQLKKYVREAEKQKGIGVTDYFICSLERRVDNVVYRLSFAETRKKARQMVSHGHITVNGRKIRIPSRALRVGDVVGIREASKNKKNFDGMAELQKERKIPSWLSFDNKTSAGTVKELPTTTPQDILFDVSRVFEYYSR